MNDPGIDGPIGQAADDVEGKHHDKEHEEEEAEVQDFLDPSRWWFASTACPLIAGTFGPMANAFSICALVESWRIYIPEGNTEANGVAIEDPNWLIAINSVSLAGALIANMALLLNMARKAPFAIAQPITIVGWLVSSALLIALVSVASSSSFRIEPSERHALSQAYYYGIMAAGLYFIISILMIITVLGAYCGHYPKEFRLTTAQRTLMLQTISFMVYLLIGALIFSKVEGWYYLDAVYWADFTLLTVGIGDFAPATTVGRGLLFPFAIGGIVTIGLVIGSIRSLVLDRGKHKLKARFTEKRREQVLSTFDPDQRTIKIGPFTTVKFSQKGLDEAQRREQEFLVMRQVQDDAKRRRQWTGLAMSTLAAIILSFVGAVVFWTSEKPQGWTYFQAFYFSYVSLLTIGYGDISPTSNAGKAFFVFWSLLAVPTLTILISNMGDTVVKIFRDFVMWIGAFTLLPDERTTKLKISGAVSGLKKAFRQDSYRSGILPETSRNPGTETMINRVTVDRLAACIGEKDVKTVEDVVDEEEERLAEQDSHFYNYVLASEIRQVMKDTKVSPPKQYTYSEWAHFLKILGQDETNVQQHRAPPGKMHRSKYAKRNGERQDLGKAGQGGPEGAIMNWSWLGVRSPLMGNMNEAEWLLDRLTATLEHQLKKTQSRDSIGVPPISKSDLIKKQIQHQRKSSAGEGIDEENQELSSGELRNRSSGK